MKNLIIISSLFITGCSSITPIASVIGASAATTSAYYQIKGNENITVLSKECLFLDNYLPLKLEEQEKTGLLRSTKEKLAGLNLSYKANCKTE